MLEEFLRVENADALEKRWRTTALQDAGARDARPLTREASWSAPVLWRFVRCGKSRRARKAVEDHRTPERWRDFSRPTRRVSRFGTVFPIPGHASRKMAPALYRMAHPHDRITPQLDRMSSPLSRMASSPRRAAAACTIFGQTVRRMAHPLRAGAARWGAGAALRSRPTRGSTSARADGSRPG